MFLQTPEVRPVFSFAVFVGRGATGLGRRPRKWALAPWRPAEDGRVCWVDQEGS